MEREKGDGREGKKQGKKEKEKRRETGERPEREKKVNPRAKFLVTA